MSDAYRRFWVGFAAAVEAERHDLPWPTVEGWRLSPDFLERATRLLDGVRHAERDLSLWMHRRSGLPPAGSRLARTEVTERLVALARVAAASDAAEDRRGPAALAREQTGLTESGLDEVRAQVELAARPPAGGAEESTAEQRRTRQLLAELMATLRPAGLGDVRAAPDHGPAKPRRAERAAAALASRIAGLPDVAAVSVLEERSTVLVVENRRAYADLLVTGTEGRAWLAELKVRLGSREQRALRTRLVRALLADAGGEIGWATVTRREAETATAWAELTRDRD